MLVLKICTQTATQNSLYPLHCLHLVCLILIIITPGIIPYLPCNPPFKTSSHILYHDFQAIRGQF